MNNILLIILSILSGVVAGMGMGGGTFLIPVLTIIFAFSQHTAQGINLFVFIPTAIISLVIHLANNYVDVKIAITLTLSGVLASVLSSLLAVNTNSALLKKLFGGFLLIIGIFQISCGIYEAVKKKKNKKINNYNKKVKLGVYTGKMFK